VSKKSAKRITEKLKSLPTEPGVYMFKNIEGKIIYVGKAASLRNRVRSYFQSSRFLDPKTYQLENDIDDFEFIVTSSERESLILEDTLVKKHQPRYNIKLRDDKRFPYLKLTNEPFPRIMVVRRIEKDVNKGARYFGPYTNAKAMRKTKKLIQQLFHIRTCSLDIKGKKLRNRPCLDHYIGLCDAPCVNWIDSKSYGELVDDTELFLHGHFEELMPKLRRAMKQASTDLQFERAALLRDQIGALTRLSTARRTMDPKGKDQDAIGFFGEGNRWTMQIFFVRAGKLVERESFPMNTAGSEDASKICNAFVKQYYAKAVFLPKEILLSVEIEEKELIEEWLTESAKRKVQIHTPQRGDKAKLVKMAMRNAELAFKEEKTRKTHAPDRAEQAYAEIEKIFGWEGPFERIEAFDISNIQGSESVASMVVFKDGKPFNNAYRRFKMKSQGPDDFAMMAEVVRRRLERALAGDEKFLPFPDLILIDGGKGQLNAARQVMWDLGLEKIPTLSLAKEFEQLFMEGQSEPYVLPKDSPALQIMQYIRDEAHRFAVSFHRKRRDKRTLKSLLDDIPGVGPARKRVLLDHFGSMKRLREASLDELLEVPKMPREVAQNIFDSLKT
jgi:excinuclease ABC subunit C